MDTPTLGAYMTLVVTGFLVVLAILALLMPLFVFRIQSDVTKILHHLKKIHEAVNGGNLPKV